MDIIKIIKTEHDYQEALKMIEKLIARDPDPDSAEGEQLSLLTTLVEDYESRAFPKTLPDPIEAIRFRMEQAGLKPADLIPYIGSRSRVSEILSGKRQLTLDMVRALSEGLGIPAEVLIQKPELGEQSEYNAWDNSLIKKMGERGYFGASFDISDKVELLKNFFTFTGNRAQIAGMLRKSPHYRISPLTDKHALRAWATQVVKMAKKIKPAKKYKHGILTVDFLRELARKSVEKDGPVLAQEYLKKNGIILVIEYHLPKTYLDGATVLIDKDNPIIGLTLRYDRLDNFWFTLMHELAHIALHYNQDFTLFYDEIEGVKGVDVNGVEQEADQLAREVLVPNSKWEVSPAKLVPSPMAAQSLADELGVHIAIVAGVMRHEHKNYYYLNKIVNNYKARDYFNNQSSK